MTSWMVPRDTVVFVGPNITEHRSTPVPLALCELCGARVRVLPVEFLPHKTYSLPVIEECCRKYLSSAVGLRKSLEKIEGISPHYSTLHGWLGALGEKALDRAHPPDKREAKRPDCRPPTSSIIAETAKRRDPGLVSKWTKTGPEIDGSKYQSGFRKERLQACFRLLLTASSLFGHPHPLTRWEHCLITHFFVPGWQFVSRSSLTGIQLDDIKGVSVLSEKERKPVRMRSP